MSDDKIVSFERFRRDRGGDDARFICCTKCGGGQFAVVVRFASGSPFVASLLCIECEPPTEIGVSCGMLDLPGAGGTA